MAVVAAANAHERGRGRIGRRALSVRHGWRRGRRRRTSRPNRARCEDRSPAPAARADTTTSRSPPRTPDRRSNARPRPPARLARLAGPAGPPVVVLVAAASDGSRDLRQCPQPFQPRRPVGTCGARPGSVPSAPHPPCRSCAASLTRQAGVGRGHLAGIPLLHPRSERQGAKRDPRIIGPVQGSPSAARAASRSTSGASLSADRGTRTASNASTPDQLHDGIAGQRRLRPTSDRGGKIVQTPSQKMFVRAPGDRRQPDRETDQAQVEERMAEVDGTAQVARIVPGEERPPGAV